MGAVGFKEIGRLWVILVGDEARRRRNPTGGEVGRDRGLTGV
jgi:hypothetical protein